jgi:hypothetical protein
MKAMTDTHRAILIDPEKRTITEIQIEKGYEKIQEALGCRSFTAGSRPLTGSIAEGFDTLYVSDDDMEDRDDPRFWFQVDTDRDPPSSYPIAGLGLAAGIDEEGGSCDVRISVADLTPRITFTQRKFRGFEVTHGRGFGVMGGLPVHEMVRIEPKVPVIDGTDEDDGSVP